MSAISNFFGHFASLFTKAAPKIEALLKPEVDLLNGLIVKFAAADLTTASTVALAAVTSNVPLANAVGAVATTLKANLVQQGIEATADEVTLVAQSLVKSQAAAANTAIAAGMAAAAAPQPTAAAAGSTATN